MATAPRRPYNGVPCKRGHQSERSASSGDCVLCRRAREIAWTKKNPTKKAAKGARDRSRHPERVAAQKAKWERANVEHARAKARASARKHSARRKATRAEWERRNPLAVLAKVQRRRARIAGAPGRGVSASEWARVIAGSLGLCAYCGQSKRMTMDHIDPLSAGGAHDVENIAACCKACNSSKGDAPLVTWMARRAADMTRAA